MVEFIKWGQIQMKKIGFFFFFFKPKRRRQQMKKKQCNEIRMHLNEFLDEFNVSAVEFGGGTNRFPSPFLDDKWQPLIWRHSNWKHISYSDLNFISTVRFDSPRIQKKVNQTKFSPHLIPFHFFLMAYLYSNSSFLIWLRFHLRFGYCSGR